MQELSFGELKLGLACCTIYKNCAGCPLYQGGDLGPVADCTTKLMTAALNCIRVMETDLLATHKRCEESAKMVGDVTE
jgi:hypothetical protein